MAKATEPLKNILTYLYLIIIIISSASGALIYFTIDQARTINLLEHSLSDFHLPSMINLNNLSNTLDKIEYAQFTNGKGERSHTEQQIFEESQHNNHLIQLISLKNGIALIKEYPHNKQLPTFQSTLNRLDNQYELFANYVESISNYQFNQSQLAHLNTNHQKLEDIIEQLRRLHSREAAQVSDKLSQVRVQIKNDLIYSGSIGALVIIIIVAKILHLSHSSIRRYESLQSELTSHRDHLEEEVSNRTKKLEASNQELNAYSYSIAHDLKTPLRAITSFSQITLSSAKEKLNNEEISSLERVIGASKHMAKIITQMLELSRITRSELIRSRVNLTRISQNISNMLDDYSVTKQKVVWHIEDKLFELADESLVELLLYNLLENALKYSRKNPESQIHVGLTSIDNKNTFFVKDNGEGFDMKLAGKIFQPFQRLHTNDEIDGMGVGLAIAYRVIQKHDGKIWAESKPNEGTTLFFTLN